MNCKNNLFATALILWIVGFLFFPLATAATLGTDINEQLEPFEDTFGEARTPSEMIADIIKIILTFLGVIFVVLIIYAGFLWMTAGGNEEQIKRAKGILTNSVIGLIIVLAAYGITKFIINQIIGVTTGTYPWQH